MQESSRARLPQIARRRYSSTLMQEKFNSHFHKRHVSVTDAVQRNIEIEMRKHAAAQGGVDDERSRKKLNVSVTVGMVDSARRSGFFSLSPKESGLDTKAQSSQEQLSQLGMRRSGSGLLQAEPVATALQFQTVKDAAGVRSHSTVNVAAFRGKRHSL